MPLDNTSLSPTETPPLRSIFTKLVPLRIGALPKVRAPMEVPGPGASVPPLFTVTKPEMMPVPPKLPPFTVTPPNPVPEPVVLLTNNFPAEIAVPLA